MRIALRQGNPGAEARVQPTVKHLYMWLAEGIGCLEHRALRRAAGTVHTWPGARVVAFDYHQMLDMDQRSTYRSGRIENFLFLPRHRQTIQDLRQFVEQRFAGKAQRVLTSHIHNSQNNFRNLLICVNISDLFRFACNHCRAGWRVVQAGHSEGFCARRPIFVARRQSADWAGICKGRGCIHSDSTAF